MIYWVIYDVTENKIRSKIANKCKNYGLRRVQKSAFLGSLSRNKIEMLSLEIKEVLNGSDDAVFIFPSCESCFRNKIIEGKLDEESVKDRNFVILSDGEWKSST